MITQTPWIERKFEFNYPVGLFPVILERLRGTLPRIEMLVKDKTDQQLINATADSWSVKQQIGHLYDLEDLWYGRIEDFLAGEKTLRAADMTNAKTKATDHNAKNFEQLITEFARARNKLIAKIETVDETTARITALHPRLQKPMRLIDSLFFIAEHDDHHLAKMRELVKNEL